MRSRRIFFILAALVAMTSIRAQELLNYPLDTIDGEEVYRYEVERSIGLYRIGVNFGVQQNDIIRLNPQLRERGLHYGETLLIPTKRPVVKETKAQVVQTIITETRIAVATPDSVVPTIDSIASTVDSTVSTVDSIAAAPQRKVIELALLLPFESRQIKRSVNADRMMEFYEGALLALRDLQNDSTLYRLRVYDTERSERRVNALCDSTELDSVQGILGPVYPIQIEIVAKWCEKHQVPLMLPFSDEMDLQGHPYLYQFNSPDKDEAKALAQWIANREDRHCVFVETRESDLAPSIRLLRQELKAQNIPYSTLALRDLINDSVNYAIDQFQENIFILHSDRYQQVRMALPHIAKIAARKLLVSQYSWQKENIDMPQVYTSKFASDIDLTAYDQQWQETYKNQHVSEMPRYDLLGYDLMREMISLIRKDKNQHTSLQSPIVWESSSEQDGWQNTYIHIVEK